MSAPNGAYTKCIIHVYSTPCVIGVLQHITSIGISFINTSKTDQENLTSDSNCALGLWTI